MTKGYCFLSAVPMRKEPSDRAEMVNQLLFGETFEIVEQQPKWTLLRCDYDHYEGWVDNKQYSPLNEEQYRQMQQWTVWDSQMGCLNIDGRSVVLSMGCCCPPEAKAISPWLETTQEGQSQCGCASLIDKAKSLLGTPYLWGGRSFMGIDCSGFTQVVFKSHGARLQRDASQQVTQGFVVASVAEATEGDLCFFQNADGRVTHVGIYMGNGSIIHASGCVRIDSFDKYGIYNAELQDYTHRLHSIRRVSVV